MAGAFGGAGTTTYAENIGVMAATRVYSTAAYIVAAFAAILFGLCPKFGVLVGSIPAGVLGGVTIVLYGMIAVLGAKIWVSNRVDFGRRRNLVPAAAGIILGAGDVTLMISDKVSLGGITMGTVVALVAYHLFRYVDNPEDEATDVVTPTSAYHEEHDHAMATTRRTAPRRRHAGRRRPATQDIRAGAAATPPARMRQDHRVKPSPFGYAAPASTDEALAVLAQVGDDGKVLAGGQSLLPILNMRLAAPGYLVDINRIAELAYVRVEDGGVRVGALARHADVERDGPAYDALPLLRQALRLVAHPVIRNRGTTVGSLAHADPSGEMTAVLALTGGAVAGRERGGSTRDRAGGRLLPRPAESACAAGELAVSASFPAFPAGSGTTFVEVARRHGDYAVCGLAAAVTLDDDGVVAAARAAYVSVAPTPLVLDLTDAVAGAEPGAADWAAAGELRLAAGRPRGRHPRHAPTTGATWSGADRPRPARGRRARPQHEHCRPGRRAHDVQLTVNGVPRAAARARPAAAVRLPAPRPAAHRHPRGLRARRLRGLHGAARRRAGALLPAARGDGRRATRSPRSRGSAGPTTCTRCSRRSGECHGLQCGFCTPGFLTTVAAYIEDNPTRPRPRPARRSAATCAAARATRTSSPPSCAPPRSRREPGRAA